MGNIGRVNTIRTEESTQKCLSQGNSKRHGRRRNELIEARMNVGNALPKVIGHGEDDLIEDVDALADRRQFCCVEHEIRILDNARVEDTDADQ